MGRKASSTTYARNYIIICCRMRREIVSRHKSKKAKPSILKYLFLIIGGVVILLVLVSWFAFPSWHSQPGGFWALIGLAVVGGVGVIKDVVDIIKNTREMQSKSTSGKSNPSGIDLSSILQFGRKNKVKVEQHGVNLNGTLQAGEENEISIGTNLPPKRRKR
jgi:hypothetical protein